ncbi:SDR family NAD(P)-dependent oxidoreductase [Brasilonema sp. CT11]|nr:SDR family NAD(P)-dependent oxidoreductase [Brasilonema sp. CT11]
MMEPILEAFAERVKKVTLNPPKLPYISNLTGDWITVTQATNPEYYAQHLRFTVLFASGVEKLLVKPEQVLLEVGPGHTLTTLVKRYPDKAPTQTVLTSVRHPQEEKSDSCVLFTTLGQLWLAGVKVDWFGFYSHQEYYRLPLPTYPFERQRYWIDPPQKTAWGQLRTLPTASQLWTSLIQAGQNQANARDAELNELTYQENNQWLERLCTAYINFAFQQLKAFSNPEEKYSLENLLVQFHITPRYQQLLSRWLQILVEQGQLQQQDGLFTGLVPSSQEYINEHLEEVKARMASTSLIVNLVQRCGENLAAVVVGEQEPLEFFNELAYQDEKKGSDSELALVNYYNSILRSSLEQVVKLLPSSVRLRVLEIGAGTGLSTQALLPVLPPKQTNYTFTDIGKAFLIQAQQKFKDYPFVEYRLLDIDKSPTEQGFEKYSFDVVIASNVLHATRNIDETLYHIRSLLAPGGFLLLWEITQPKIDFDMSWGLLLKPLDDKRCKSGQPFITKDQWFEALRAQDFFQVAAFPETEAFEQKIIMAAASATELSAPAALTTNFGQKETDQTQVSLQRKQDVANWFYIPSWKRSPLPFSQLGESQGSVLLFINERNLSKHLVKQLQQNYQKVILVKVGDSFRKENPSLYTLNPRQPKDYQTLLAELRDRIPQTIVHLWSLADETQVLSELEEIDQALDLGFYSLLFLAQAFGKQNINDKFELIAVTNKMQDVTGEEELRPEQATLIGPIRTIPQEYPDLDCRIIDVVIPQSGSLEEKQLIEQLEAELKIKSDNQIIAYRKQHRWIESFESVKLDNSDRGIQRLKKGGVYLITGGLGGVGLALAEYLAQKVRAKLILTGRNNFPARTDWEEWLVSHDTEDSTSRKIHKVYELEKLGAEVLAVSADVTNLQQMQIVIAKATAQFGKIDGIIHGAGVTGDSLIQQKTKEQAESVMTCKVKGTLILDGIFRDSKLDFFIVLSSLNSIISGFGQVDYCAANAFLDAFAHRQSKRDSTFTSSINWDGWQEVGIAANAAKKFGDKLDYTYLQQALLPTEGVEAFSRILHNQLPQVLVSTIDFFTRLQQVKDFVKFVKQESVSSSVHLRPELNNSYVAPSNSIEQKVADIWQELLGIKQIGIHDNFFELGGDSLIGVQVMSRLRNTFCIQLSVASLFEFPTIAEIAPKLEKEKLKQNTKTGRIGREKIEI